MEHAERQAFAFDCVVRVFQKTYSCEMEFK